MSSEWWEDHYARGGISGGDDGSDPLREPGAALGYTTIAAIQQTHKASVVTKLLADLSVRSVGDFGCGDGIMLPQITFPPGCHYTGLDVSESIVRKCRASFPYLKFDVFDPAAIRPTFDMTWSLSVVFHLLEDQVFREYMAALFDRAERHVLVFGTNYDSPVRTHFRHRGWTRWVEEHRPQWRVERREFEREGRVKAFWLYAKVSPQ